ncbi:methyltransferase family protein [Martelella mediterranea]|uniref:Protein-S-isoprenylcysteine O-methyltransferase Ste14 n=2 Tax=Martelella mediterranea TaxID=293089 RepID=A0A4R3NNL2_9HYPH|nr:isoprenylcysteine carboxylmethyltransferase family protein [Martelella mediterranea]AQZ54269.1 Putative protein-S-isoprenylcysteine methyltransferase [Martelella mediterranea DSM 17316]TCT36031.1 protein-S-isoprenylcysteine O-methyltransferase Ste14 [Martelella mediterranea]
MSSFEAVSAAVVLTYMALFLMWTMWAGRASGRSVWLFGKGSERQGLPALLFRLLFTGTSIYALVALFLGGAPADPMHVALFGGPLAPFGALIVLAGAALSLYSQVYMGRSWRIGAASGELGRIVRTGPFAISRNPVFVGQMVLFFGLFLALPSLATLALTLVLIVAVHLQVRIEERVLDLELGVEYRNYRRDVHRWI